MEGGFTYGAGMSTSPSRRDQTIFEIRNYARHMREQEIQNTLDSRKYRLLTKAVDQLLPAKCAPNKSASGKSGNHSRTKKKLRGIIASVWNPEVEQRTLSEWLNLFLSVSRVLRSLDRSDTIAAWENLDKLTAFHQANLKLLQAGGESSNSDLKAHLNEMLKNQCNKYAFIQSLRDVICWLRDDLEPGDCYFFEYLDRVSDSSPAFLFECVQQWIKRIKWALKKQVTRWCHADRLFDESLLRNGFGPLPDFSLLWEFMGRIPGFPVPAFPIELPESGQSEPHRTLLVLATIEQACLVAANENHPTAPIADGPVAPCQFRYRARLFPITRGTNWKLLNFMWGRDPCLVDTVIENVWPEPVSESTLGSCICRLNSELLPTGYPGKLSRNRDYVTWVARN